MPNNQREIGIFVTNTQHAPHMPYALCYLVRRWEVNRATQLNQAKILSGHPRLQEKVFQKLCRSTSPSFKGGGHVPCGISGGNVTILSTNLSTHILKTSSFLASSCRCNMRASAD